MIIGDNVNVYNLNLSHLSIHQLLSNILYTACAYTLGIIKQQLVH